MTESFSSLTTTDIVVLVLLLLFFIGGWNKGLMRSLIGPLSLCLCSFLAILHYDLNGNLFMSLLIVTVGTMIVSFILGVIVFIARRSVDKEFRNSIFLGSRILGALINTAWKGVFLIIIMLILTNLPLSNIGMGDVERDIRASESFYIASTYILPRIPLTKNTMMVIATFRDPEYVKEISSMPQYEHLIATDKVQNVLADDALMKDIEDKNYIAVMNNPQMKELINDGQIMKEFSRLSQTLYKQAMEKQKEKEPSLEETE